MQKNTNENNFKIGYEIDDQDKKGIKWLVQIMYMYLKW